MKHKKLICIFLALLTLLTACSSRKTDNAEIGSAEYDSSVWSSTGRPYKQSEINIPENYISVFARDSDYYMAAVYLGVNKETYAVLKNGSDSIYSPTGSIECAAGNDRGIWLVGTDSSDSGVEENLRLITYSGEVLLTVNLENIAHFDDPVYTIRCTADTVYLKSASKIVGIDSTGKKVSEFKLENTNSGLAVGSDGKAYLAYYTDKGTQVSLVDGTMLKPAFTLQEADGRIYGGNAEFPLIMADDKGLYGLTADGKLKPVIIWSDCGIALSKIVGIVSMPDGKFMLFDMAGVSLLSPSKASEMRKKTTLVLATVGSANNIKGRVMKYNISNSDTYIQVRDYSEDGTVDRDTAVKKLNVDIVSGNSPDLIQFTDISPSAYISHGWLIDMCPLMDKDSEVKQTDIAIAKQLKVKDGIYYLDGTFGIDTRVGLYSDFGDALGWTFDKYLSVEKSAPKGMEIMYNTTRSSFLRGVCSRYMQKSINWETKTCGFDTPEFTAILETCKRLKENPEPTDPREVDTTPAFVRMKKKTLYTAAAWVGDVWSIAAQEKQAGFRLSFIGWPTADGICGSDIALNTPIGICAKTKDVNGCWSFIKYLLTSVDKSASGALPVYMPYLKSKLEAAMKQAPDGGVKITQAEADRFLKLLDSVDNVALYDESALKIIEDESTAFFAGQQTVEETVKNIQSRVSIYVSEQS